MTTNNLIGYDPLAWMDGETIEDAPIAPVKKSRSKAKPKPKILPVAEQVEETVIEQAVEASEELPVLLEKEDEIIENEDIEIDVSIDENGEIEITIETNENENIAVDVEIQAEVEPETEETILDIPVENVNNTEENQTEIETMSEEINVEETVVEEAIEAVVEPLVELPAESSLKNIAELHDTFKRVLAAHDKIEINASDVTTIDTATFQMLIALKKDATHLGKTINIIYPSARFVESAKLLDLLIVLDVPE